MPRVVDEDPAHEARGDTQEVTSVAPFDSGNLNAVASKELEVGLVNQSRSLQGVAPPLAPAEADGDSPQLVVDERQQLGPSRLRVDAQASKGVSDLSRGCDLTSHGSPGRSG